MGSAHRQAGIVLDTRRTPHARLRPVPIGAVRVTGGFWGPRLTRLRTTTLPQQYEQLEANGTLDNFRRVSGRKQVEYRGSYGYASDLFKWLEAASFALASEPDPELDALDLPPVFVPNPRLVGV